MNVRGHGAAHALNEAIRVKQHGGFDAYGVIADTDQHWGTRERQLARQHGIFVVENAPCIEATLLRVANVKPPGDTAACKREFELRFGDDPSREGVIKRNFSRAQFVAARSHVEAVDQLLRLIRQ